MGFRLWICLVCVVIGTSLSACALPHARHPGEDVGRTDATTVDVLVCSDGSTSCNGRCEDLQSNVAHCGACGNACALDNAEVTCSAGVCGVLRCRPGYEDCDRDPRNGCEAQVPSDQHCGACGTRCAEPQPTCDRAMARCVSGCSGTDTRCDGGCVDLQRAVDHCGSCGNACSLPNAVAGCGAGRCVVASCNAGFGDCDGLASNGCETALGTDANCGACGQRCSGANPVCDSSVSACRSGCTAPAVRCGASCVDTRNSVSNCGACGRTCSAANAVSTCAAGSCAILRCNAGWADCDGSFSNGCEVNLMTSLAHCGRCGGTCAPANATARCIAGSCSYSACNSNFGDCDGNALNGCEIDLRVALPHCGTCGRNCATPNGTPRCSGSVCQVSACNAPFLDCDRNAVNGCEVNSSLSVLNCGACNNNCSVANSTASCAAGRCSFVCTPGFSDCDRVPGNGCEVDTTSNVAHCGGCGMMCPTVANAVAQCSSGACRFACLPNFADCDSVPTNGCEADLRLPAQCNMCGNRCPSGPNSTATCVTRACGLTCAPPYANCDNNPANGCEVDLQSNDLHCGRCSQACPAGSSCMSGGCVCAGSQPLCGGVCCASTEACVTGACVPMTPRDM
ncbi:MAG: hypothetical protein Q8Q09_17525 [Deltaproteobacteria bacterium]|nr:hypothetical protein [Deltaproteobacteria bacterium]